MILKFLGMSLALILAVACDGGNDGQTSERTDLSPPSENSLKGSWKLVEAKGDNGPVPSLSLLRFHDSDYRGVYDPAGNRRTYSGKYTVDGEYLLLRQTGSDYPTDVKFSLGEGRLVISQGQIKNTFTRVSDGEFEREFNTP